MSYDASGDINICLCCCCCCCCNWSSTEANKETVHGPPVCWPESDIDDNGYDDVMASTMVENGTIWYRACVCRNQPLRNSRGDLPRRSAFCLSKSVWHWLIDWLIDWLIKVLWDPVPLDTKIGHFVGHFGDAPPSQFLGHYWNETDNRSKNINYTKYLR